MLLSFRILAHTQYIARFAGELASYVAEEEVIKDKTAVTIAAKLVAIIANKIAKNGRVTIVVRLKLVKTV
jgi:hypothetical protein